MALVNMKRPKRKDGNEELAMPAPGSGPDYSYGLVTRLENFELDQLGVKQLPQVGKEVTLTAKAKVIRVAESTSSGNKGDRNVELQITHLEVQGIGSKGAKPEDKGRAGKTDSATAQ